MPVEELEQAEDEKAVVVDAAAAASRQATLVDAIVVEMWNKQAKVEPKLSQ